MFNKPLNEWHDEPVEITTMDPVIKNGKVVGTKEGKRIVKQKVMYSQLSEPSVVSCSALGHEWFIPDPHTHVAHCKNCPKRQFIRAVYEMVKDGKILPRHTVASQ